MNTLKAVKKIILVLIFALWYLSCKQVYEAEMEFISDTEFSMSQIEHFTFFIKLICFLGVSFAAGVLALLADELNEAWNDFKNNDETNF